MTISQFHHKIIFDERKKALPLEIAKSWVSHLVAKQIKIRLISKIKKDEMRPPK